MKCERCHRELQEDERYRHGGQTLCEDCYLEAAHRVSPCDPWAAYHARSCRDSQGLHGGEGLSELQRAIYDFIESKGRVSMDELWQSFDLPPRELETSFAVLRHCGLVRAYKENGEICLTTLDSE